MGVRTTCGLAGGGTLLNPLDLESEPFGPMPTCTDEQPRV